MPYYEEYWVTLDLLPNYAISNYGRVVNINTERELKASKNDSGHLKVDLYHNGKQKQVYVHRLVAKAFFVDYEEGREVGFINGNKEDCGVLNLTILPRKVRKSGEG